MPRPAYFTLDDVTAKVPLADVVKALDDDGDGVMDDAAWTACVAAACNEVDGTLGQRYDIPFAAEPDTPTLVHQAALLFFWELLYLRRGFGKQEDNPWIAKADKMRTKLDAVAAGEVPLTPTAIRPKPSVSAVTESARSTPASGHISC